VKHLIKGFVHCQQGYDKTLQFSFFGCDMSPYGYAIVEPHEIEVDVPDDFTPVPQMIAALRSKKEEALQKLAKELMDYDDEISKLLAITNESTPPVSEFVFADDGEPF
jgi:hypothetical protein